MNIKGQLNTIYSLRFKVAAFFLVANILSLVVIYSTFIPRTELIALDTYKKQTSKHLETLSESLIPFLVQNQTAGISETLDEISARNLDWKYIEVLSAYDERLYPITKEGFSSLEKEGFVELSYLIELHGSKVGYISLVADPSMHLIRVNKNNYSLLLAFNFILFIFTVINVIYIDKVLVKKIMRLSEFARSLYKTDLTQDRQETYHDEISDLTSNLILMKKKIIEKEKRLEQALHSAELSNNSKSEFLANMSHEIRTPINGILGMAQVILHEDGDSNTRVHTEDIRDSALSLLNITNDILDVSKIDAGKVEMELIEFDVNKLVKKIVAANEYVIINRPIDLKLVLPNDDADLYVGDPGRIRQVLSNLINNAMKFTEKGCIHVRLTTSKIDEQHRNLHFEVEDSGIGLSEEGVKKLFKPFSQADSSTTRKYGGTGLGLSIVKGLIDQFGGHIEVESSVGKGAKFKFTIPLKRARAKSLNSCQGERQNEKTPYRPKCDFTGLKVLVVEDNLINQKVTAAFLTKINVLFDLASDGKEAVEKVSAYQYDMVLMDCQMPTMDGYEATKIIRGLGGYAKDVPIIAMTANAMKDDFDKCLKSGMSDYVKKPILFESFVKKLEEWVVEEKRNGVTSL